MDPGHGSYAVTGLNSVMAVSRGSPLVVIGIVDSHVATDHPALVSASVRALTKGATTSTDVNSMPSSHGTAVAGMLVASRNTPGAGICPDSTLVVRPVFDEHSGGLVMPARLADAIVECVAAGARIINISASYAGAMSSGEHELALAVDHAARRGVIVVAAAGNDGRIGGSPLLSHPWVIPVTATDQCGIPLAWTNLGRSIGRRGLAAPGAGITALTATGGYGPFTGTSAAAPMVTGAIALAWSAAPGASAAHVRTGTVGIGNRRSVTPPLLNAVHLYRHVASAEG